MLHKQVWNYQSGKAVFSKFHLKYLARVNLKKIQKSSPFITLSFEENPSPNQIESVLSISGCFPSLGRSLVSSHCLDYSCSFCCCFARCCPEVVVISLCTLACLDCSPFLCLSQTLGFFFFCLFVD